LDTSQLISHQELNKQLYSQNLSIIDCRFELADPTAGRRAYTAAHIPGAVYLDLNSNLASAPTPQTGRHPLPDIARIEATLGCLGIAESSNVVVYDSGNGAFAARAWWILRWLGHDAVQLLDGGMSAWSASDYAVSAETVKPKPQQYVAQVRNECVITTKELCANAADIESLNLLDARDADRFAGVHEPIDAVAGHIPGARNLPFTDSLNADGGWKERGLLRELWASHLGDDRHAEWIAMCGSGVTACHLILSAVEAGYREPRLYVGSWSEWIADPARPVNRSAYS
jgi:thiosulfate/3-mercaptopyruvate sulfurtransferase